VKPVSVAFGCVLLVAIARAQQLPLGTAVGGSAAPSGYDGGGRDPFVSLLTARKDSSISKPKTAGSLTEVSVMAVSVKGILRIGQTVVAVLEGPGGRSFIARVKDRLQDGVVKTIDFEGVTLAIGRVDAAGTVHSQDVRKPLRLGSEAPR
jgi:hypothetical protein